MQHIDMEKFANGAFTEQIQGAEEGDGEHPGSEYRRNRQAEDHCCDRI